MRYRMRRHVFAGFTGLALVWLPQPALAGEPVGRIETIQGSVVVRRQNAEQKAAVGAPLETGDLVATAAEARAVVKLVDGTTMTLGENAQITIDSYVFKSQSGLALFHLASGALRFVSGKIGRLQDKRIEVRTPAATLAARGTEFWVGPIDGSLGAVALRDRIEVRNAAGSVLLADRRMGTQVKDPTTSPEPARYWPEAKVRRALALTALK